MVRGAVPVHNLYLETSRMPDVKDPVCGMTIDAEAAAGQSRYEGQTYYFCSTECRTKFDANPRQFAGSSAGVRQPPEQRPDSR